MPEALLPARPPSLLGQDPAEGIFAWFRTMLASAPVHCDANGLWHVFDHADVSAVLSDPATFSSDDTVFNPPQEDIDLFAKGNIVDMDPPQHRKLRGLVSRVFTPRVVAAMSDRIEQISASLLDEVQDQAAFDLVDTLAYPLPVTVIAELLGVPTQDLPLFRGWAEALFSVQVDASTLPGEELNAYVAPIMREMNHYLLEHIRHRRAHPADDLLGRLTTARLDGEALQDDEIIGFAGLLLLAGHVTTTALLGNAILCLCRRPDAAGELRADLSLLPGAIEEVLRMRTPFPRVSRVTTRETSLAGKTVPPRRLVIPWVGAANRDPVCFAEPDRFDIHRDGHAQLAFGHGIHFCLGAPLARLEGRIALAMLLTRYRDIVVDLPRVEYHNPWVMVAARRLPVQVVA
jgi:cytochrome P450